MRPPSMASECQSGRSSTMAEYRLAAISRVAHTIRPLPGPSISGIHPGPALLPVLDDVRGQSAQPLGRAVDGVDHRHRPLDLVPLGLVEVAGELVGGGVELLGGDAVVEPDGDQPRLVVDGHGGAVGDGAGEVVDVDVVAEHLTRVAVGEADGRAGERDERGVGEGVGEVAGVAVEVVVVPQLGRLKPGLEHVSMPQAMGNIPFMTRFATSMMKKQMEELEVPDVPDFIDLLHAAGAHMYACKLTFDMMKMIEADLHPGVEGVISATDFIEISEGAQVIFV